MIAKELKERKLKLSHDINNLIRAFVDETGLDEIEVVTTTSIYVDSLDTVRILESIDTVLSVKL